MVFNGYTVKLRTQKTPGCLLKVRVIKEQCNLCNFATICRHAVDPNQWARKNCMQIPLIPEHGSMDRRHIFGFEPWRSWPNFEHRVNIPGGPGGKGPILTLPPRFKCAAQRCRAVAMLLKLSWISGPKNVVALSLSQKLVAKRNRCRVPRTANN